MKMLQALHSKSAAKARQGAHFWASMIEQEEEEEEEEKETGIEFATTYLPHMPALVEGLMASLICLAEVGDLPGRPADCLILLCRFLFTSVRSSLRTPMPHYYIFFTPKVTLSQQLHYRINGTEISSHTSRNNHHVHTNVPRHLHFLGFLNVSSAGTAPPLLLIPFSTWCPPSWQVRIATCALLES